MELQTISAVSKKFNISTRTLRYYEKIGLLQSVKKDGYAYRTYNKDSLIKLGQIIVLRKLRIPLKEIKLILQKQEVSVAIEIFEKKINEISDEVSALSTIKSVLKEFSIHLHDNSEVTLNPKLIADEFLLKIIDSLTVTKINFKEEISMKDLNYADEKLSKLTDVRIVYLPPASVAAIRIAGVCPVPEDETAEKLNSFIKDKHLAKIKPDFRHYGFNNPNTEMPDGSNHGYERWVTIPEDMEVEKPFVKKDFAGGLYAAHTIAMGNFDEWKLFCDFAENNPEYEPIKEQQCFEEHLNYINLYSLTAEEINNKLQLDLLIPVKEK